MALFTVSAAPPYPNPQFIKLPGDLTVGYAVYLSPEGLHVRVEQDS